MSAKLKYFTKAEWTLWISSVLLIVGTFVLFHRPTICLWRHRSSAPPR